MADAAMNLEYPPLLIGGGFDVRPASDSERIRRDREYFAGTTGFAGPNLPQALSPGFDDIWRRHGPKVWKEMLRDPMVGGCFEVLKLGVLSNGMKLSAKVKTKPGAASQDPRASLSAEVAESCGRMLSAMKTPVDQVLWAMLDGVGVGCKIAEKVYGLADRGQDAGRLVVEKLKVKPNDRWRFVVDNTGEVLGYQGTTITEGGIRTLPPEKFFRFTWGETDGDPRGTKVLALAFDAWHFKMQAYPELFAASQQFGTPGLLGETAEDEQDQVPVDEKTGDPIEGAAPISPQEALAKRLERFRNGGILAVPYGTKVTIADAKFDGSFFAMLWQLLFREIQLAILKSTRLVGEAEHGSKADSETSQDVTGLVFRRIQRALCDAFRLQVLWHYVALNWGEDVADEHTPDVSLGLTEHQDFAKNAAAVALLMRSGFFARSQLPYMDDWLGIQVRTAEEVAEWDGPARGPSAPGEDTKNGGDTKPDEGD